MHRHTRREMLPFLMTLARPTQAQGPAYDLIVKGGEVVDPSQNLRGVRDIAVEGSKIVRIAPEIPAGQARVVIDARKKIVTPGLVDIHVHVYDGVAPLGIPADPNCIAKGATTVVDAGSAGANTFPGFRRMVLPFAETRVFALLNISLIGQSTVAEDHPWGELLDLRHVNTKLAIQTIEKNRDVILGVKVRLSESIAGGNDLRALEMTREVADAVRLPLMVHIGGTVTPLARLLTVLKSGDVITHSFHGRSQGILDSSGRVLPEVRKAVESGVRLDVGHGKGSFSWSVMESAYKQGITPGTISSDVHQFNVAGPVFDLATTLSKFLHLGMSLEQVIERATAGPARAFRFPHSPGTLRPGAEADIAVFEMREGDFEMYGATAGDGKPPEMRIANRRLVPVATVKAGKLYGSATIPVVRI
jgi:dihydroorotase